MESREERKMEKHREREREMGAGDRESVRETGISGQISHRARMNLSIVPPHTHTQDSFLL